MKPGDLFVGGNECYRITEVDSASRTIKVRLVAGSGLDLDVSTVPTSFLDGRTLYRAVAEMEDVDARIAIAEVSNKVDTIALGWNARSWVEAFTKRYEPGHPVPDRTTLLGWFAHMIDAGADRVVSEQAEKLRDKRAMMRKRRENVKKRESKRSR